MAAKDEDWLWILLDFETETGRYTFLNKKAELDLPLYQCNRHEQKNNASLEMLD